MRSVLVDAGPLIALADRSDKHHRRVAAFLRDFSLYRLPSGKALRPVL